MSADATPTGDAPPAGDPYAQAEAEVLAARVEGEVEAIEARVASRRMYWRVRWAVTAVAVVVLFPNRSILSWSVPLCAALALASYALRRHEDRADEAEAEALRAVLAERSR